MLQVLLVTSRPIIREFFRTLQRCEDGSLDISCIAAKDVSEKHECLMLGAQLAIIDLTEEPMRIQAICRALRTMHSTLPILTLQCCERQLPMTLLEALTREGVEHTIDLTVPFEEMSSLLREYAQHGQHSAVRKLVPGELIPDPQFLCRLLHGANAQILQLVAQGLSNDEISQQLALSPHTIKHYIDHLRAKLGVRNRIALAAWVGRNALALRMAVR